MTYEFVVCIYIVVSLLIIKNKIDMIFLFLSCHIFVIPNLHISTKPSDSQH